MLIIGTSLLFTLWTTFSNLFEVIKLLAGSGCVRVLKILIRAALHHALHNVCVQLRSPPLSVASNWNHKSNIDSIHFSKYLNQIRADRCSAELPHWTPLTWWDHIACARIRNKVVSLTVSCKEELLSSFILKTDIGKREGETREARAWPPPNTSSVAR